MTNIIARNNVRKALSLFIQLYRQYHNVEVCIAELKRMGFTKLETIEVLTEVADVTRAQAEELVRCSLAWSN